MTMMYFPLSQFSDALKPFWLMWRLSDVLVDTFAL